MKSTRTHKTGKAATTTSGVRDSKSSYHHGDLRRALFQAALDRVEREGEGALSLRDAARAIGVSQAALYNHWSDKEALVDAVAAEALRALTAALDQGRQRGGEDPTLRRRYQGVAYVRFALERPHLFRLAASRLGPAPRRSAETAEAAAGMLDRLRLVVHDAEPGAEPHRLLVHWAVAHGLATILLDTPITAGDFGARDVEQLTERVMISAVERPAAVEGSSSPPRKRMRAVRARA